MNADDLRLDELVRFGDSLLDLHGRRLIIHDAAALAQYRRDLIEMVGWDDARRILTRMGYFWGQADAAAMKRIFHWECVEQWLKAAVRLPRLMGCATCELISFGLDEASGTFSMDFASRDSVEVEMYLTEFGICGQTVLLGAHGLRQRLCFLLPRQERVLRGTGVPCQRGRAVPGDGHGH